jgi:molybdopterin-guanine dinucleotide biosynthesis protein A
MGRDKAALELAEDTLLYRLVHWAAQWTPHVVLAGRADAWERLVPERKRAELQRFYHDLIVDGVSDAYPGKGPIAGLEAGLRKAVFPYSGLIACDMPFVSRPLMLYLYRQAVESGACAVIPEWQGRLQPMHAVYHKGCLESLEQKLQTHPSSFSFREWLVDVKPLRVITETELSGLAGEDGRCFFNMNTPGDYKQAVEWVKRGEWRGRTADTEGNG